MLKLNATTYARPGTATKPSHDRVALDNLGGEGLLGVVSDGVGSARDPARCAERVVRLVTSNFAARPREWPLQKSFDRLIEQANHSLYHEGVYLDGTSSMQATVAVVCLRGGRLSGLNVGDSPVLRRRGGVTERLSRDHCTRDRDGRDTLTQAVGMGPLIDPHYFEQNLCADDLIIVTSDGLTKLLADAEIGELAERVDSAQALVEEAVRLRPQAELDDLSAIRIRVEQVGAEASGDSAAKIAWPQPAKGKVFADYVLQQRIGGNDRVWLARKGDQRFVVKFIPQEAETDDSGAILARFCREVWNACQLHGDSFVPARRAEDGSPYYYIMDYLEAPSLSLLLKSRRLTVDEAVELGCFLCRAAGELLQHELVHGDIKPDNVLISRQGDAISFKLLDLGLAAPIFTEAANSGTPMYLAPERFRGACLTERTELFSIGATLYHLLAGRPPFGAIERFQTPKFGRLPRPSRLNPNLPLWLDAVLLKCLSLRQERRFQTYTELLFALEHPDKVPVDYLINGPLLERNPLLFYQVGFWLLFGVCLILLALVLGRH